MEKSRVTEGENARRKGEVEKLIEWAVPLYTSTITVK